jgi:integrase
MSLTELQIKALVPKERDYKVTDSGSLYLVVSSKGAKYFRWKYSLAGKEKALSLGMWPAVTLKAARAARDAARIALTEGRDPAAEKQRSKLQQTVAIGNTFKSVADHLHASREDLLSRHTWEKERGIFDRDLYPWLGARPVGDIQPPELLAVIRRIEQRSAATAARALTLCKFVFKEAVLTGKADRNPALDLSGAVKAPRATHMAAQTTPETFAVVLRKIWKTKAGLAAATAIKVLPYVFTRPGELVKMRWSEIDFTAVEWRYLVTKTQTEHIVPLAPQVVALLTELQPLTGHLEYVFSAYRTNRQHLSENTINSALRAVGVNTKTEQTGHGFRASARTLLAERLGFEPQIIEHQLAHSVQGALGRAYNRTRFLEQRKEMMTRWADYIDALRTAENEK